MHTLLLAAFAGAPALMVPSQYIGILGSGPDLITSVVSTVSYKSKITEREEQLPFAVAIMGVPGAWAHKL